MKIYTKTGDKKETSLIGKRVLKSSARVDCYGNIDELCANVSYLHNMIDETEIKNDLKTIMNTLLKLASDLANVSNDVVYFIKDKDVAYLENKIDYYSEQTPNLKNLILPIGSNRGSFAHIVRTITRRCERSLIRLSQEDDNINDITFAYLNRLSDYFFALARYLNHLDGFSDIKIDFE